MSSDAVRMTTVADDACMASILTAIDLLTMASEAVQEELEVYAHLRLTAK